MSDINKIKEHLAEIKATLIEKTPSHFNSKHIISAFFGALLLGLTFMFKGLLYDISLSLTNIQLILIILTSLAVLSAEIYFIGYSRVKDKIKRPFFQFWIKRLITYYLIALFVSSILVFLYGIHLFTGDIMNSFKIVVCVSFPCAVGAAASDLVK